MNESVTFASPPVFAKRVNLPVDTVRKLAKEGKLPHIRPGTSHIQINVEAAEEALKNMAQNTAELLGDRLPTIFRKPCKTKRAGRPPDSVRLATKER